MQNQKVHKWLNWVLISICVGQALYIYISFETLSEPARIVSINNIDEKGAVYEVLYDSGGATVPLIYRYYLMERQDTAEDILDKVKSKRPFLVTKSTAAVQKTLKNRVKLKVIDTIYEYRNTAFYKVNGEIKIIKFDLDSTMP